MTNDADDREYTPETLRSFIERLTPEEAGKFWEMRRSHAHAGRRRSVQCDPDLEDDIDFWRDRIRSHESKHSKAYWTLREAALGVDEFICQERVSQILGGSVENPWDHAHRIEFQRWSDAPQVEAVVDVVFEQLLTTEAVRGGNKRKLKTNLRMALLNLYHHFFTLDGAYTAYPRRSNEFKANRYNTLGVSYRSFTGVVDGLLELGLIGNKLGFQRSKGDSRWSRMWPELPLIKLLREHALTPAMGAEIRNKELVQLKDSDKHLVDYADTDETNRMRAFLERYNAVIDKARIPIPDHQSGLARLDTFAPTRTYRVFNDSSFELGGRFYGPWWQQLTKEDRSRILINGNPTIELDYRAQFVHLLFGLEGQDYHEAFGPDSDPYALDGHDHVSRAIRKKALLVAFNAESEGSAEFVIGEELDKEMIDRKGVDLKAMLDAFADKHKFFAKYFFTGIGKKLQYLDSQITEFVFRSMLDRDLVVLGIHDSFIVEQQHEGLLRDDMVNAFHRMELPSIPDIVA